MKNKKYNISIKDMNNNHCNGRKKTKSRVSVNYIYKNSHIRSLIVVPTLYRHSGGSESI